MKFENKNNLTRPWKRVLDILRKCHCTCWDCPMSMKEDMFPWVSHQSDAVVHWCCTWHTQKGRQSKEMSHLHCSFIRNLRPIHLLLDKIPLDLSSFWIHLLYLFIFLVPLVFHEQFAAHCFSLSRRHRPRLKSTLPSSSVVFCVFLRLRPEPR